MTLARLGTTSLFLGVWTPLVALAIVWAAAGSGAPIVFALEQAGVSEIDRTAVALVFAPPLPYLFALGALAIGLAAQRFTPDTPRALQLRRAAIRLWVAAGLTLCAAAPLSLYAEHRTSHEPEDQVHLALLLTTWMWLSITATAISVALVLRTHVALASWAFRSRPVAGASLGFGVLTMGVASVAVLPSPARAPLTEAVPMIDSVATETETLVLALAGTPSSQGAARQSYSGGSPGSGEDDDRYTVPECLEELGSLRADDGVVGLQRVYRSVDVSEIAIDIGIEICEGRPRRGHLGGMLFDATKKRVISQLRHDDVVRRNEADVRSVYASQGDIIRRGLANEYLQCLMEKLSETDRSFLRAELLGEKTDEIAAARSMTRERVQKAMFRARTRAKLRRAYCDKVGR